MGDVKGAWKNTNLYFFTPDIEQLCEKAARNFGPQWKGVGSKLGYQMWKIDQMLTFKADMSGKLYRGDCYICLHTYEEPGDPYRRYDVHFWVGAEASEDEYGASMYKTSELDRKLRERGLVGSMHREIQDFESELFLNYFPKGLHYLDGGSEGVTINKEEDEEKDDDDEGEYAIRLYQVKGRKGRVMLSQVPTARASMNSGDVFVLDAQAAVYQWNGKSSNDDEKARGAVFAKSMCKETYPEREVIVLEEGVDDSEEMAEDFWSNYPSLEDAKMLGISLRDTEIKSAEEGGDDDETANVIPTLYRLRETFGGFSAGPFAYVSGGTVKPALEDLRSDGIYLVDSGFEVSVWLGERSSMDLHVKIFPFTMLFIRRMKKPPILNIHIYREGNEPQEFKDFFGAPQPPSLYQKVLAKLREQWIWQKVVNYVDPKIVVIEDKMKAKRKSQLEQLEDVDGEYSSIRTDSTMTKSMTKSMTTKSLLPPAAAAREAAKQKAPAPAAAAPAPAAAAATVERV